jgi:hypothetical protein
MTALREAAQQALEALDAGVSVSPKSVLHDRLRDALAQQEPEHQPGCALLKIPSRDCDCRQEPVAYTGDVARRMREAGMTFHLGMPHSIVMEQMTRFHDLVCAEASIKAAAAFATPPRREWQVLSEEEIDRVVGLLGFAQFSPSEVARAIEAKLKEKNHE